MRFLYFCYLWSCIFLYLNARLGSEDWLCANLYCDFCYFSVFLADYWSYVKVCCWTFLSLNCLASESLDLLFSICFDLRISAYFDWRGYCSFDLLTLRLFLPILLVKRLFDFDDRFLGLLGLSTTTGSSSVASMYLASFLLDWWGLKSYSVSSSIAAFSLIFLVCGLATSEKLEAFILSWE